jgi:hypothetical protein
MDSLNLCEDLNLRLEIALDGRYRDLDCFDILFVCLFVLVVDGYHGSLFSFLLLLFFFGSFSFLGFSTFGGWVFDFDFEFG